MSVQAYGTEGVTGSERREEANGARGGGGSGDRNGVGGRNRDVNGDGDGNGAGTRTEVQMQDGKRTRAERD